MSNTVRLTTAQALVRWLVAQRSELFDGTEVPLFAGAFAIFGHGNVLGLGTALYDARDELPTWRGQTEEGMALAAVAYARATDRRQVMVATSSVGPGALNMVTAAGVAHANRLPVLFLPGDTFTGRGPDPVLQQVEHFGDPTTSVNDSFRAVSRYFDRITRPEQLLSTLPQVARVLTDPADAGPVTLALPQDVQAEAFDFPAAMFAPRVHRVLRTRPDLKALASAAEALRRAERPLLVLGGGVRYSGAGAEAMALAEKHNVPDGRDRRRPHHGPPRPPVVRRASGHHRLHVGEQPGCRRRRGRRGRNTPAGLHNCLLDRLLLRCPAGHGQRSKLRRGQAQRDRGGGRCEGDDAGADRPARRMELHPRLGRARRGRRGPPGTPTSTVSAQATPRPTARSPTPR